MLDDSIVKVNLEVFVIVLLYKRNHTMRKTGFQAGLSKKRLVF